MNYDYYRIFYYVAKYKSITGAARILLASQPNITRTINNLEHELNCRLFLRSHRGMALTPEGEKLFAHVQVAQEQLQAAEHELSASNALQSGHISVSASETALHYLLLPVLREFRRCYPGVRIQIANHSTPQAVAALKTGTAELAVVTTPTGIEKPLQETQLIAFQDILIAGPGYAQLAGRPICIGQLAKYPFVSLARETKTYEFYNRIFLESGLALEPDIEAATADQILPMVKNDLGLGFLPEIFAREGLAKEEVYALPLVEPIPQRHICLVRDKSRPLSMAAQKLQDMLCRAAQG